MTASPWRYAAGLTLALGLFVACAHRGDAGPGPSQEALAPGDHQFTIPVDGRERWYILHVPPESRSGGTPLVVAFHGGGGNPGGFQASAHLDDVADREGFLVAYPAGTGPTRDRLLTWNAGTHCCGRARELGVDDVAFARALVQDIGERTAVDSRRVYATGHSNGAMMAYRVAAEAADLVAAIAPVSGAMQLSDFHPSRPVAVLHIHSVDDPRALYDGGLGPPFPLTNVRTLHEPVEAGLAAWREVDGCEGDAEVVGRRADAGDRAEHVVWGYCRSGARVELWRLHGPGHAWPGADVPRLQRRIVGPPTHVIDAAEEVWAFFERVGA